jgi:hypothetical protein
MDDSAVFYPQTFSEKTPKSDRARTSRLHLNLAPVENHAE